jgi:hypothetical protein
VADTELIDRLQSIDYFDRRRHHDSSTLTSASVNTMIGAAVDALPAFRASNVLERARGRKLVDVLSTDLPNRRGP